MLYLLQTWPPIQSSITFISFLHCLGVCVDCVFNSFLCCHRPHLLCSALLCFMSKWTLTLLLHFNCFCISKYLKSNVLLVLVYSISYCMFAVSKFHTNMHCRIFPLENTKSVSKRQSICNFGLTHAQNNSFIFYSSSFQCLTTFPSHCCAQMSLIVSSCGWLGNFYFADDYGCHPLLSSTPHTSHIS